MKYAKLTSYLTTETLISLVQDPTSVAFYHRAVDKTALVLAAKKELLQRETDVGTSVEVALEEETKTMMTGRVVILKTTKESNRENVLRFLKDSAELAVIARATVNCYKAYKEGTANNSTPFNRAEAGLIARALKVWWSSHRSVAIRNLIDQHAELVACGKISHEKGNLDERIVKADEHYRRSVLPVFTFLESEKVQFDNQHGLFVRVCGSYIALKYLTRGKNNRWADLVGRFNLDAVPLDLKLTAEDFTGKGIGYLNRVLFKLGDRIYQYKDKVNVTSVASDFTFGLSYLAAKMLLSLTTFNPQTMDVSKTMHFGASLAPKVVRGRDGYTRSVNVLKAMAPWYLLPQADWGVTNSGKLSEGYSEVLEYVDGWLEANPSLPGTYKSLDDPSKTVARIEKLCKKSTFRNTITLNDMFIVNEVLEGDPKLVIDALCTGVIYLPAEQLTTFGQCRVVSEANKLGLKGTFSSIGFISRDMEKKGLGLLSFGSAKSNAFGIKATNAQPEELKTTFNQLGEDGVVRQVPMTLKGFFVEAVDVVVTNHYMIQQFMPTCLVTVLNSFAEANDKALDKVVEHFESDIDENEPFVDMVRSRAEEKGVKLADALVELEAEGAIKRKPAVTTWTPTEFDTMATYLNRDLVEKFINELVRNRLNKDKFEEYKILKDFLDGSGFDPNEVVHHTVGQVVDIVLKAMELSGVSLNVLKSKAPSRAFLVHLVDGLYGVVEEQPQAKYIVITSPDGNYVAIPTGRYFEGATFDSSVFLSSVVASGFISLMLPYLELATAAAMDNRNLPEIQNNVVSNLSNMLESNLLGKDMGRLNSAGGYYVLSIAPWATAKHDIYLPNTRTFGDKEVVVVTKHPAVFKESHAGAVVHNDRELFANLVGDSMSPEMLTDVLTALGNTAFCHPDMLLSLQNDSDGDLVRLTKHKTKLPLFGAIVYDKAHVLNKFHLDYAEGERGFLGKGSKSPELKEVITKEQLLAGCEAGKKGKDGVAIYTANAQRFAQTFGSNPNVERYADKMAILLSWVQMYAMNNIKHNGIKEGVSKRDAFDFSGMDVAALYYMRKPVEVTDELSGRWFKAHKDASIKAFMEFVSENGMDEDEAFADSLFQEVRFVLAQERTTAVIAISRNRSALEVSENPLRGAGLVLNTKTGSLMDYLIASVLGKGKV